MRHLAYFTVKSNLPLEQFETFLATSHSCGLELGNINHSRLFVTKFLSLVDTQLISKTLSWFKDQENVTITLDIGTENCLPLLAVLFISQGQSKLADIVPVLSKKGVDSAKSCFKVCCLRGLLDIETLKMKTVGVTGDGAFCN